MHCFSMFPIRIHSIISISLQWWKPLLTALESVHAGLLTEDAPCRTTLPSPVIQVPFPFLYPSSPPRSGGGRLVLAVSSERAQAQWGAQKPSSPSQAVPGLSLTAVLRVSRPQTMPLSRFCRLSPQCVPPLTGCWVGPSPRGPTAHDSLAHSCLLHFFSVQKTRNRLACLAYFCIYPKYNKHSMCIEWLNER